MLSFHVTDETLVGYFGAKLGTGIDRPGVDLRPKGHLGFGVGLKNEPSSCQGLLETGAGEGRAPWGPRRIRVGQRLVLGRLLQMGTWS